MIRPGIRRILRLLGRRWGDSAAQVDEEIQLHIELRRAQLEGRGWTPEQAEREALRRFGPMNEARRNLRWAAGARDQRMRVRDWLGDAAQDLGFAWRTLRREPLFTTVVVLTLALGTGANAAMFGVVDRLLLRGPDHVVAPETLYRLYMTQKPAGMEEWTSHTFGYVEYGLQKENARAFDVATYTVNETLVGRGESARAARIGFATADFFPLLGVKAQLGRFFTAAEDDAAGPKLAVIGHAMWQSLFQGGDVLGRTVDINGVDYTVIGVAPRGFTGVDLERVDFWVPMSGSGARMTQDWKNAWDAQWLKVVARLEPGRTLEQATTEATAVHQRGFNGDDQDFAKAVLSLRPITYNEDGGEPAELSISRWLIGVSLVVLLIACANVANLMLARAMRRKREVAVRLVLGISRSRLARLLMAETVLLALLGTTLGLILANWGAQFLRAVLLPDVEWSAPPISARVLGFSLLLALATALLIGALPLLQAGRARLSELLKSGAREGGGRRSLTRSALTVAQAALSVVLLVGAGLFVKSLANVRNLDLGIDADRVVLMRVRWARNLDLNDEAGRAREKSHQMRVMDQAMERAGRAPGLESVSSAVGTPFQSSFSVKLRVPGSDSTPRLPTGIPRINAVSPRYFETVGTQLRQGRGFTSADGSAAERVAVVNQTMANTIWPGQDALGKCLLVGAEPRGCTRVVGIAEDARRFQLREAPSMSYYIPLGQEEGIGGRVLLLRPRGELGALADQLRRDVLALDPTIRYVTFETLQESVDPMVRPWRLGASMFVLFGALALLIALVGLYSLIAYLVSSRTQELGVRMALGARAHDIIGMILRQAVLLTALGIVLGVLLALAAGEQVGPLLFDVSPRDPMVFGAITLLLLGSALLASVLPARRAVAIDPASSLRSE